MIRRTLRNGLVAAVAAVAVFPVTAVASAAPASYSPNWVTPTPISVPGWNTQPTAPQHKAPKHHKAPRHKAPKHHVRKHHTRCYGTTHARRYAMTPTGYHRVTRHARHHLAAPVWGRVTTHHMRLNVRSGPGTGYRVVGSRPVGRVMPIVCKTRGSNVFGNQRWYRLPHHKGYVSAHYVRNRSTVRWC